MGCNVSRDETESANDQTTPATFIESFCLGIIQIEPPQSKPINEDQNTQQIIRELRQEISVHHAITDRTIKNIIIKSEQKVEQLNKEKQKQSEFFQNQIENLQSIVVNKDKDLQILTAQSSKHKDLISNLQRMLESLKSDLTAMSEENAFIHRLLYKKSSEAESLSNKIAEMELSWELQVIGMRDEIRHLKDAKIQQEKQIANLKVAIASATTCSNVVRAPGLPATNSQAPGLALALQENGARIYAGFDVEFQLVNKDELESQYSFVKELGKGGLGSVSLLKDLTSSSLKAIKTVRKFGYGIKNVAAIRNVVSNELKVLSEMRHKYIVEIYEGLECVDSYIIAQQYYPGGDLFSFLENRPGGRVGVDACRFYVGEILQAIEFIHGKDYVFHDLKLENVMIDAQGHIKVIDFGGAVKFASLENLSAL
ncbi:hypothetical protein HK098_006011 [Nowakowskiella sp. JEL0407]|nr:hypothetical protein HK098_006011 [Nowakowskiella sp. JEL0407]